MTYKEIIRTRLTLSIQYTNEADFTPALEIVSDSDKVLHPAQHEYGIVLETLFQGIRELVGVRGLLGIQYDHTGLDPREPQPDPDCSHEWVIKEGGMCVCAKCNASLKR